MPWYVTGKDFTHAAIVNCVFCGRALTSGIAFVVHDGNGNSGFSGNHCVRRAANYPAAIGTIPDFTSATYLQNIHAAGNAGGNVGGNAGGNVGGNAGGNAAANHQVAITYLLLRFERLSHYIILVNHNTARLTDIYNNYFANRNLPQADVNYLLTCANNMGNYARFNFINLMRFYCLDELCDLISQSQHPNLLPQDIIDKNRIIQDMYRNTVVPPADVLRINQILHVIGSRHRLR